MSDRFTFEDAYDERDLPEEQRAALTVSFDGTHFAFNFSENAEDGGREVYLTPDAVLYLAEVLDHLNGVTGEDEDEGEDAGEASPELGERIPVVFTERPNRLVRATAVMSAVALALSLINPVVTWVAR